jgi:hypothetical protein
LLAGLFSCVMAQTVTLSQLPYQDPRPLENLLAMDELRFGTTIAGAWPQTERMLARYVPPSVTIDAPSVFFSTVSVSCLSSRQPAACRAYIDFIAFLMRSKQPKPIAAAPLPVLLRPQQLPWRDTAILNAILVLDADQLQSALDAHWDWMHSVITRYLPDHFDLHPISKVFGSVRDTCQSAHSEIACRLHVSDIDTQVDTNRYEARPVFLTLSQIRYRDPAPLDNLLRQSEQQLRLQLAGNWPRINGLLNQYINWNVAIAGNTDFARSRLDCQAWFPGDYFMCRTYLGNLADLMRSKRSSPSPFGQALR